MFSASIISATKRMQEQAMPDRCTIYSPPAPTAASKGEAVDAVYPDDWTAVSSNVKCRLTSPTVNRGMESAQAGQVQSKVPFDISIPLATTRPSEKDRVRITTKGNRDFEIKSIPDGSTGQESCLMLQCMEVR